MLLKKNNVLPQSTDIKQHPTTQKTEKNLQQQQQPKFLIPNKLG
jgi:hypothetical protein